MAKETKPAAPAKGNNTKTYIIAAVAVIVVILLIVWGRKGAETPAAPETAPAPEQPAAPETAPEAAPAEAAPAEEAEPLPGVKEYDRTLGAPGNAEITESTITWKAAGGQPVTKEEGATMFSGITCQHAERDPAERVTEKEDTVGFTLTNKGKKTYHLYYVKYGSEGYEDAMRINVNGRRVRDVEKACGQNDLAPGETISCSGAAALLRSGTSYTGKELVNILQAESMEFIDNVVFKC